MAQWINHVYTHQNFLINCAIDQVQWSLSTSVFFPVENSMGLKYLINMFSSEKHKMFCERAQNKFISENYPASFFFFFFVQVAFGILVPWPGIEPMPSAV